MTEEQGDFSRITPEKGEGINNDKDI